MVRLGWGATGNSGRELTRGCYALKHKYYLPCSPTPCCNPQYRKNVYHDEGVILSHICWGPGAPLPFSRPQTPPPPRPSPPQKIGWKVEGSRRMARCYAPPPPVVQPCCDFTYGRFYGGGGVIPTQSGRFFSSRRFSQKCCSMGGGGVCDTFLKSPRNGRFGKVWVGVGGGGG